MNIRTIETPVHGRFLYEERGGDRLLVGFHGYAESAEVHLAELHRIEGSSGWSLAAIQALHPFYTKSGEVVANWMTKVDRELAMADNIEYVRRVLASLPRPRTLAFLGFSQGATMAARAAAFAGPADGLILLGGDVPPDVKESDAKLPPVLLARGVRDEWYSEAKFKDDLRFLEGRTRVTALELDAGHEWTDPFRQAATEFLEALERRTQSAER